MITVPKSGLLAGSAAFAALGVAGVVHGQIVICVDQSNPILNGNGASWSQAFRDLQAAFDSFDQRTPDQLRDLHITIKIAQGTYHPSQARQFAYRVGSQSTASAFSVTVQGGYAGLQSAVPNARDFVNTPTVLSADTLGNDTPEFGNRDDNCEVVLAVQSASSGPITRRFTLDGVTIQGGHNRHSTYSGTGLRLQRNYLGGSTFTLTDCTLRDNDSNYDGAGMGGNIGWTPSGSAFTITRCTFANNSSGGLGGGAQFGDNDVVIMFDCSFVRNSAYSGGAVVVPGYADISNVRFLGNHAYQHGGAVHSVSSPSSSPRTFWNCLLVGNDAGWHGGATYVGGNVRWNNCTIAHNSARIGGGVFVAASRVSLEYGVIGENWVTSQGPAMAGNGDYPELNGECIEDGSGGCYFPFATNTLYPYHTHVDFKDPIGPDGNAMTWQDNDYHLDPRLRLVDSGRLITSWTEIDLDGNLRPVQGILGRGLRTDLGCYESQLTLCPTDLNADAAVTIDDFLDFLQAFELGQPLADLTTNGQTPFPDGAVTVDDLLFFLAKFEQGC